MTSMRTAIALALACFSIAQVCKASEIDSATPLVQKKRHGPSEARRLARVDRAPNDPAVAGPVKPQNTPPETERLRTVLVTAEKRTQSVETVPISMSVFTQEEMQKSGIIDLEDIATQTPGVGFRTDGPGRMDVNIRGLTAVGGVAPTVGMYLDDYPVTPTLGVSVQGRTLIDPDLYDMERVEVLEGPQGTLFGSGSMGGTVRFITAPPKENVFQGSADAVTSATRAAGWNWNVDAMLNIPLIADKVALRLVGTYKDYDGYIDRYVLKNFYQPTNPNEFVDFYGLSGPVAQKIGDVNTEKLRSARATLLITPLDGLTIEPLVYIQSLYDGGASTYDYPTSGPALGQYRPFDIPEPFGEHFQIYGLTVKYDLPRMQLVSDTSYFHRDSYQIADQSIVDDYYFGVGYTPASIEDDLSTKQVSQEVRLLSTDTASRFQWLVGLYYDSVDSYRHEFENDSALIAPFGEATVYNGTQPGTLSQRAAYVTLSYKITQRVKLEVGAREYNYRNTASDNEFGIVIGPTPTIYSTGSSNTGLTPKATLSYFATRNTMLYASAGKGFRPGAGVGGTVPTSGPDSCLADLQAIGVSKPPTGYGPDSVWDYETGVKTMAFEDRLQFNGDVYYIDWTDIQQAILLPTCGFGFTTNIGTAFSRGFAAALTGRPVAGLSVSGAVGYTDAEITSTNASVAGAAQIGQHILNAPTWTTSASGEYDFPIAGNNTGYLRASYEYVGGSNASYNPTDPLHKPAYRLVNARLGFTTDRWNVALFVDNLLNEHAELSVTNDEGADIPWLERITTTRPETIGVDVSTHF